MRRTSGANRNVIDPTRLFPTLLKIAFPHIGHVFLRQIELVTVGIVRSQAGEWHMALALGDENFGIILFEPVLHFLHVLNFKAEMIESGAKSRLALQQGEADHAVAQMAAFFVIVAILVGHPGGNLLHAEDGFVEVGHAEVVIRMDGDVPDFRGHGFCLLVLPDSFQSSRSLSIARK